MHQQQTKGGRGIPESSDDDQIESEHEYSFQQSGSDSKADAQSDEEQIRRRKQQILEMEEKNIREELKSIPFGEILKYRKLKEEVEQLQKNRQIKKDRSKRQIIKPAQKLEKNASREIKIMKRPLKKKFKPIFETEQPKSIDPRFEDYTGHYNADLATKSYSFIRDIQNKQVEHLKKQIKNSRLAERDRQILLRNYNKVTNDMKRFENQQIQNKVRGEFKDKNYKLKKREFKEHVQKAKLQTLGDREQDKRIKKKEKKIQKQRTIQRKKVISHTASK